MKMKKRLALLLAAVLLVLTACTTGQGGAAPNVLDPKNPTTVTLWHYYVGDNQQALEQAVSLFNQTVGIEQGVIVDPVAKGSIAELEEAVTNSAMGVINADPMPDIFSSYPDKAMEIDALEKVCDLNEYFTEEEKALYVEDFLADGLFEGGRFLVVPIVKSTELLYVNATAWDAFATANGVDATALKTWEDIYATARAHYQRLDDQTPDTPWDGGGLIGVDSVANYIIIGTKQLGVDVIDAENRQAVLDEAALRRVFDTYYKGMCLGYFNAIGKFRSDDIKSGDLVGYVGSSSSAAYFPTWIEQNGTQSPIGFLPLAYPVFQGGTDYAMQQGAGMCIAKTTPEKQAGAAVFLKWFTAAGQNIEFAMTTGYLPVQTAAYESEEFAAVLDTLRGGDESQQNVAGVYEIALNQITGANTYAAKPFPGSYDVRSALQGTLMDITDAGRATCEGWKKQGLTEDEILQRLDVDARFGEWLQAVRARLDEAGIAYTG